MSDVPTASLEHAPTDRTEQVWTLRVLHAAGRLGRDPARALPTGDCVVGRAVEGRRDLLVDDSRLSRSHACFKRRGDQLSVHDLGSRHGTRVNGLPVAKADLADGDVVRCGDTILQVRLALAWPEDDERIALTGSSPAMMALRCELGRVAASDHPAVLLGETGVGKGAAARAIHAAGRRAAGPWVAFNCAAIPETLAESTLFGHVAGAFTGATTAEAGLLRAADGGTLFIDEVGDLPGPLQPKLLHFLDDGTVLPVGSSRSTRVDARVIAATNVDLAAAIADRRFRADLWARLAALVVRIPPLRERREDVLELLVGALSDARPLTGDLAEALVLHDWPWNVREVQRVAAELEVRGAGLDRWDLPLVAGRLQRPVDAGPPDEAGATRVTPSREVLEALLRKHDGVVSRVARELGRSSKQVYRWMERQGLDPAAYRA